MSLGTAERLKSTRSAEKVIGRILPLPSPFALESGEILPSLSVAYETYGTLNAGRTNAVVVCHALTGSARAADSPGVADAQPPPWWSGIIGKGKALDTDRYFVVCSNILGSCYGTTGPASINPESGRIYRMDFPQMTVRDMVRVQYELLKALGVEGVATVIGGSLGGMQVLEWGILYPDFVRTIIPVATAAKHSAWCIGLDESQRLAITSDPAWNDGDYDEQPARGLAVARMIAMISYRSRPSFESRFGRDVATGGRSSGKIFSEGRDLFQVESYLRYQGEKLVERFDANTYLYLTRAMDLHDVGTGRGSVREALSSIRARTLCIGITSDILYPADEQREIADSIPGAGYVEIDSPHGHDAFLMEFDQMNRVIGTFLG